MPPALFVLTAVERQALEAAILSSNPRQSLRSRIVLAAAAGMRNAAIAADLNVDTDTVGKWRRRFATDRLPGLLDWPRPGAPRQISDREISERAKRAQTEIGEGTRLTLRLLAATLHLPRSTLRRRLLEMGLHDTRSRRHGDPARDWANEDQSSTTRDAPANRIGGIEVPGDALVDKWVTKLESVDRNRIRPNAVWALVRSELTTINQTPIVHASVKTWPDLLQAVEWVSRSPFGFDVSTAVCVDASRRASAAEGTVDGTGPRQVTRLQRTREVTHETFGNVLRPVTADTRDQARVIELALCRFFEDRKISHRKPDQNTVRNPHTRKLEYSAATNLPDEPITIRNASFCSLCWRLTNPVKERRTNVASRLKAGNSASSAGRNIFCRMHSVARGGDVKDYRRAALLIGNVSKAVAARWTNEKAAGSKERSARTEFWRCLGGSGGANWVKFIDDHFPNLATHKKYGDSVAISPLDAIIALDDVPYIGRENLHNLFRTDLASLSFFLFPMLLFADTWIDVDHRRRHGGRRVVEPVGNAPLAS